jgi:hypothetical protein
MRQCAGSAFVSSIHNQSAALLYNDIYFDGLFEFWRAVTSIRQEDKVKLVGRRWFSRADRISLSGALRLCSPTKKGGPGGPPFDALDQGSA